MQQTTHSQLTTAAHGDEGLQSLLEKFCLSGARGGVNSEFCVHERKSTASAPADAQSTIRTCPHPKTSGSASSEDITITPDGQHMLSGYTLCEAHAL